MLLYFTLYLFTLPFSSLSKPIISNFDPFGAYDSILLESFSLYIIARFATLGRFFQRIDAIFFFIWILAFLSFLSFNIYLITYIMKKGFELSNSSELIYSVSAILIGCSLAFRNVATVSSFTKNFFKPFTFILIFCISFLILLIANFKKRRSIK